MIAGDFSPHPYDRKSAWRFILDRLIRLGIPLLLYALVINPLVTYWAAANGGYEGSFLHYVPSHLQDLQNAAVGPLWFVEALLVLSIVYALGRLLIEVKPSFPPREPQLVRPPGNGAIGLFALGLGLAIFTPSASGAVAAASDARGYDRFTKCLADGPSEHRRLCQCLFGCGEGSFSP